jgi:DNA relaxase NicK
LDTNAHLDWISVTFQTGFNLHTLLPEAGEFTYAGKGRYGYGSIHISGNGAQALSDGSDAQGVHVILPGQTLADMRDRGYDERALMETILAHGGKLSRLDLAIDVQGGKLTVSDFADGYANGEFITTAKSATRTQEVGGAGDTFYLGSRVSDRLLRVYNKAAQLGITDISSWIRLELETKKARARAIAETISAQDDLRSVINEAIQNFLDWDNEDYWAIISCSNVDLPLLERSLPNFLKWLEIQVMPAAARYQVLNPEQDVMAMMRTMFFVTLRERFPTYRPR